MKAKTNPGKRKSILLKPRPVRLYPADVAALDVTRIDTAAPKLLPDSGSRARFETGAVRDDGGGKGFPSMIPPDFIRAVAKRYEDGAKKYDAHNWKKGIPLSRYMDAMMRHMLQWAEGDTTEDHLAAVGWNAAGAMWTQKAIARGVLPASLDDLSYRPGHATELRKAD